jgi:hypothetical protein
MLFVYETAVSARQHEKLTSSKVQTRIARAEPAVQENMPLRAYGSCSSRKNFRKAPRGTGSRKHLGELRVAVVRATSRRHLRVPALEGQPRGN